MYSERKFATFEIDWKNGLCFGSRTNFNVILSIIQDISRFDWLYIYLGLILYINFQKILILSYVCMYIFLPLTIQSFCIIAIFAQEKYDKKHYTQYKTNNTYIPDNSE